jgi:ubiquinone/menaquinone biosynthesis C-methylase UbiE
MEEQNNLNPEKILKEVLELPYGASVADLGCGSMAFFTLAAARLVGDKGVVYACDVIKDILSAVEGKTKQAGLLNIKTVWTNLEIVGATKIGQPLDYVFLTTTLFQSKKHKEMLTEAYRLLKEGGRLLLIEWSVSSGPLGPSQEMRVKKEVIENLAASVGFKKIKEFSASNSHYGLIFEK